ELVREDLGVAVADRRNPGPQRASVQSQQVGANPVKGMPVPRLHRETSHHESFGLVLAARRKMVCGPVVLMGTATGCQHLDGLSAGGEPGGDLPGLLFRSALQ